MKSEQLNTNCFCISLNEDKLRHALEAELGSGELLALVEERCPHLFSSRPVFTSFEQVKQMADLVSAVEFVVALPTYREFVLRKAPPIVSHDPRGAKGVFFGYDFHLEGDNCGLIEINTNAGGAMLNAVAARAHQACCLDDERLAIAKNMSNEFEDNIVAMFLKEWRLTGTERPLKTIAIVDRNPQAQYLYPEFILFQRLFQRHGLHAVIADPSELAFEAGAMRYGETQVDMVYNRLTDFMLEEPESAALRAAYLADAVVLTPHPQAHALYANKRNLAVLSDDKRLQDFGVPLDVRETLMRSVLPTEVVEAANAERLWQERRHLFFKPAAGYGGKAAYRGEKLTKRVWLEILAGDYIAQKMMAPGARAAGTQDNPDFLKFDIRCYAYAGRIQWTAARLYQGQMTNFRTLGGGFAPVYPLADEASNDSISGVPAFAPSGIAACCTKNCV